MKRIIDKKTIKHLLKLARLKISPSEEENLLKDLNNILSYVEELKKISVPETLSFQEKNTPELRKDDPLLEKISYRDELVDSFYERENYYLKIPAVFKRKRKRK